MILIVVTYIYIYIIVKFVLYLDLLGNKVLAKYDKIIFVKKFFNLKRGEKTIIFIFGLNEICWTQNS